MKFTMQDVRRVTRPMGVWYTYVIRPFTDFFTLLLANHTRASPNAITWLSLVLVFCSGGLFLKGARRSDIWAALLWQAVFCCDFIDGALARLTNKVSRFGAFLDVFVGIFSAFWIPFCIMYPMVVRGSDRIAFISIAAFILLQNLPVVMSLTKDALAVPRPHPVVPAMPADSRLSPLFAAGKKILSCYLTRTDAAVLAFIIGPLSGRIVLGFIVADSILLLHAFAVFAGAMYTLAGFKEVA